MAGYPSLEATSAFLRGLAEAGADAIEVGLPFSDPLADGPVNQTAAHAALENGATVDWVLAAAASVAPELSCPILLFTYLNPLLQRGPRAILKRAAEAGFAGLIVPDLPAETAGEIRAAAEEAGLGMSFLVAPTSPPERIRRAAEASDAFLYAVSLRGVTGARESLPPDLPEFLGRVRAEADCPVMVGFGIGSPAQARAAAELADGVIVGSALVRLAGEEGIEAACRLAREIRGALPAAGPAGTLRTGRGGYVRLPGPM
ncbi:MAG: tryptophan synthase subunit alpha [Firmicutes bacterium]|nr:tryptophan synthase subunit alpha [Bacillota bacterium]